MLGNNILFIEDDRSGRQLGEFNLKKAGYTVDTAASGEEGLAKFDPECHAMVITDVRMPGISGMDVLKAVQEQAPDIPVLVITAYAEVTLAVEAMKLGAFDFIGKPFNRDHLLITVKKALDSRMLRRQLKQLRIRAGGVERPIIHRSAALKKVIAVADKVAPSDAIVLITGESGTGKELIARRIHVNSPRAEAPFVAVNAAAMPKTLLEAELFGYEKGAFTGASQSRAGRFRHAEGGTLFLDEVGDVPLDVQKKLLRVLQERAITPLGTDTEIQVNVRILAATNRNLRAAVDEGTFRDDLFYRLNVLEIAVPPLRERPDDVLLLAQHFLDNFMGTKGVFIPDDIVSAFKAHSWPGNVRELENTCQRLILLSEDGRLSVDDLPQGFVEDQTRQNTNGLDEWLPLPEEGISLIDIERRVIERVLTLKQGNVTQAARYLKVPRHVLSYRMEKYGIPKKS